MAVIPLFGRKEDRVVNGEELVNLRMDFQENPDLRVISTRCNHPRQRARRNPAGPQSSVTRHGTTERTPAPATSPRARSVVP